MHHATRGASRSLLEQPAPLAVGLGCVALASRVDGTKHEICTPRQASGKSADAQAPCRLFASQPRAA